MTTTVSTADALIAALRSAHAGDTILLAAGAYNGVALNNFNFAGTVTIQSADPTHQAVLNNFSIAGSSGLALNTLTFTTATDTAAYVSSSHNITFSGDIFQGTAAGNGSGMMIRESSGVAVTGSDFSKLYFGINELSDANVSITNNTFHGLTSAAIRGSGATYETISGNTFADAKASIADHSDVIALWQDNTANHVTISGNTFGSTGSTTSTSTTTTTSSTPATTTTHASTVTVSTAAALVSAVQHAQAGDTILVAAGTYNGVALNGLNFGSAVTIKSADAAHQAVINDLNVSGSSGLTFTQLHFGTTNGTAATVGSSHDVVFNADVFQGSAVGSGSAMLISNSNSVTVTGSDIGKFYFGINEMSDNNLTVTNNTFHDLSAQGIRGTGVTNETISGNTFAGAKATLADHSDAIYLWQNNTANNVTISNNIFGAGGTPTGTTTGTSTGTTTGTTTGTSTGTSTGTTSPSSGGTTVTVGNVTELEAALKNAHGGDTILLKAGTYDGVAVYNLNYSSSVTIASADTTHQAMINNLEIAGSSGVAFKNLNVEVTGTSNYAVSVGNSSHVSLDGLTIHGTSTTGLDGLGVWVRNSNDVSVTNSDISQLGSGIAHLDDSGLTISGNTIHNIDTDGIMGGGSSHVTVVGNTITDFHPSVGAHPDAIQFFGGDTPGGVSSDVLIANNVITRGSGDVIQGIFIESTNNLTITGNAMAGTMYNGIALSTTTNALVSNNFVDGYTDMNTWIITRGGSSNVTVVHNTAQSVVNYTADGVNPNYLATGNTTASPTAVGDLSALKAWLAQHAGVMTSLTGGEGSDILGGTSGADTMSGGYGDDIYIVNNAGDVVNEAALAGVDTVKSSISSYTLTANVENLVLTGTTAQTGIGNSLDNLLTSNGVQASLNGGAGNDTLVATGNADTLTGGAGADVFSIGKVPTTPVQITDFTAGQDKLDLHTLLANYHGSDPLADKWVQFQSTSTGLNVLVDIDGPSGSAGFATVAKLAGVTSLSSSDWVFH